MAKLLLSALVLLLAGCSAPSEGTIASGPAASTETGTLADSLQLFDWSGHVVVSVVSEAGRPPHHRPTEDVLWPYWQEGILFSVDAMPQAMEVGLEWTGGGLFQIMLHSHKAHDGSGWVQHVTELNTAKPKCLRVPAEDLTEGVWQVMVHAEQAMDADFTLHVGLQGGTGHIIEDERHGHMVQNDPLIDGGVDQHEIESCQLMVKNAIVPTALPSETHFEFGETQGCLYGISATAPLCVEFQAGPGGTGRHIDGHWIQLGQPYWNLMIHSTIDQGGIDNDSDCFFTDAAGGIIGDAHNVGEPCAGQVPEGADWVFIYSDLTAALGMTVDFVLPTALPAKTHFEFGETLGCEGAMPASTAEGPACIEYRVGSGGTGAGIDGHWIHLDRLYWGLVMTSTIDQGGVKNDSNCVFMNSKGIIGESKDALPCAGLVPEDADWLFIYPYVERASRMTVDFALPPAA